MYKHILIPLDCSPTDDAILRHIRPLARLCQAKLTLIHVSDGFMARNQRRLGESPEMQQDLVYIERLTAELQQEGFDVKGVLECGEPAPKILAQAEQAGCDLIAMSTHGHGFIADLILGSVATDIRHRTKIPILMIKA